MNEQFQKAIVEIAEHLLDDASTDDRLRSTLRLCAEEVLSLTAEPAPPTVEEAPSTGDSEQPVVEPARSKARQVAESFNLVVVQHRLFLKAEAARWAAERPRLLAKGTDPNLEVRPQDQEFIRRAKEQGSYPWMLAPEARRPCPPDQFTLIAAWYENLAEAIGLLDLVIEESGWQADEITALLELAAVSQSALRVAVAECGDFRDEDQQAVFDWLRGVAAEHRIFIRAGMRLDDPTDPGEWAIVARRIHDAGRRFEERQAQARKKKLLTKVRDKASVLAEEAGELGETWGELAAVVDELVKTGLPPSNKELREALLSVLDRLPTDIAMPSGFRLAVREIQQFKQNRPAQAPFTKRPEPGALVREARKLLAGRSVVLIGGEARREAKEALERALGAKEVIWLRGKDYRSYLDFEPFVARPDVAVVVLAIRWSSHSFGQVGRLCDRHGKPLVRLSRGYNPNQVAQQIVNQAGSRLKKS